MADQMTDAAKLDAIMKKLDSAETERKADRARMDAAEEERKADRARLDAYCAKTDTAEEERKKSDAARADAARKDAEDKEKEKADAAKADAEKEEKEKQDRARADAASKEEEEKKKQDAARADAAGNTELRDQIAALTRRLPADVTPEVRQRMVGFQSRWQRVASAFSDDAGAPTFVNGESEIDYRVRLASKYQAHAKDPKVKGAKLADIKDANAFEWFEDAIYNDALSEASHPTDFKPGVIFPQRIRDAAGREITKYHGDPNACWDQFNPPIRYARRFLVPGAARIQ